MVLANQYVDNVASSKGTSNIVIGHFMSKFSVKNSGILSKCNFKALFFCNNMLDHIYVDSMALIQIKYRQSDDIIATYFV